MEANDRTLRTISDHADERVPGVVPLLGLALGALGGIPLAVHAGGGKALTGALVLLLAVIVSTVAFAAIGLYRRATHTARRTGHVKMRLTDDGIVGAPSPRPRVGR